jgi:hypothetical protein
MAVHYRNDSTLGYKDVVDSAIPARTYTEGRDSSTAGHARSSVGSSAATSIPDSTLERHGHDDLRTASTAGTAPGTSTSAPRKSRVNLACKRCKRRKQRVSVSYHSDSYNINSNDIFASVMALNPAADHAKRLALHVHMRRLFDLNILVASPCTYNTA